MKKTYILSIVPLIIGLYIYVVYRTDETVVNNILDTIFQDKSKATITKCLRIKLPSWFVYSLPGGLWIFSVSILSKNAGFFIKDKFVSLVFFPIIFIYTIEFLQWMNITDGTFDNMDLVISSISWGAVFMIKLKNDRLNIFERTNIRTLLIFICYLLVLLSNK